MSFWRILSWKPLLERKVLPISAKVMKHVWGKALPAKVGRHWTYLFAGLCLECKCQKEHHRKRRNGKGKLVVLSFKFFFILLFNHLFLKAYKVVSSSEYPLYSLAGFPKAGGEGQVPLSAAAQPRSLLS